MDLKTIRHKELVIVGLCLLIGFVLRVYTFDKRSLWMDEIHTFNDSRDDLRGQIEYYKEDPTYLHPPLFYVLTHIFYPFEKPERDLRVIPLILGTLSIPLMYLLARQFSPHIALFCTLSLTLMTYHISLSQDGRSYTLTMFLAMAGLYFFTKHLRTLNKGYLLLASFFYATLIHLSYSVIPFVVFSQVLSFYRMNDESRPYPFSSVLILNGLILFFCLPWALFILLHAKGHAWMHPLHTEDPGSFWTIIYWIFHDWVPYTPLTLVSFFLLLLFPIVSRNRRSAVVLLMSFVLPIAGVAVFCKLTHVTHFISSRYFISLLPLFLISIYLAVVAWESAFEKMRRFIRPSVIFLILFIASNLLMLPLYFKAEKQDFRGLVAYLKTHLKEGDKIFDASMGYMPGILHYFDAYPEGRHQIATTTRQAGTLLELKRSFTYQNRTHTIYHSKDCCTQYIADGNRLWIVVGKRDARKMRGNSPAVLKGFFDGSFRNFSRFPDDGSMYLFLWDPRNPDEKGIDLPLD